MSQTGATLVESAPATRAFVRVTGEPHAARTKAILRAHPEVRALIGRNPWTAALLLAGVSAQTAIAAAFGLAGWGWWWLALIIAWGVGAFIAHMLYVCIHEATHRLIFASPAGNKMIALVADITNVLPAATHFSAFHLKHHSHQGDEDADMDLPSAWEARLVGHSMLGKAVWLLLFPGLQTLRMTRVRGVFKPDAWTVANILINAGFAVAMSVLFGPLAILYLFASVWFALGLHPLGARLIQEHFTLDPAQETSSYYGKLNIVALNVGYHVEHHDIPSIPWNRLPELRRLAPEFYGTLESHPSWPALLSRFLTDPRYSLGARVIRSP